jgi:5-methylcytosine-specific restriction endonuclease McrA
MDKQARFDKARRDAYDAIYRKHAAIQQQEEIDFRAEHAKYLQTDAWKAKRAKVLERAKGICEGCLERPATQVHHVTYEHWKDELLFELVAVCRSCHLKAHVKDESPTAEGDD